MNVAIKQIANDTNFWTEFLELYKSLPALWDRQSEIYRNRKIKAESYIKMIEKLKEIDPAANREMIIRKINGFRSNYRNEAREVKYINAKLSATGSGKIYKSSWSYFDMLSFLFKQNDFLEGTISSDEYKSLTSENRNLSILPKKKKILKKVKKQTDDETLVKIRCDHLNETNDKTNKIDYENRITNSSILQKKKEIFKKVKKQTDDETLVKIKCDHLNETNDKTNKIDYENRQKKILKKVIKQTDHETLMKIRCDHLNETNDKTNKIDYENRQKKILKKVIKQTDHETLMKIRCDHLNETNDKKNKIDYENQKEDNNDEATILAKGWATQYAQLSNKQKLLSRKIISDVLFHGSLNHLTENTVQEINNILDSSNWNNDYSIESEMKIELEDYRMESEVKIEMEDYIE